MPPFDDEAAHPAPRSVEKASIRRTDPPAAVPHPSSFTTGDHGTAPLTRVASVASPEEEGVPEVGTLLVAASRKWVTCLVVGTTVAAGLAAAAWWFTPTDYLAVAFVRVRQREDFVLQRGEPDTSDAVYQRTQERMVTLPHVLDRALAMPLVRELDELRAEPDPEEWLRDRINVDSPKSGELMTISAEHHRPDVAQLLANAVTSAYLAEVNTSHESARQHRREELERLTVEADNQLRSRWETLERLAREFGTGNPESLSVREQIQLESYREYAQRLRQTRFQRNNAERALADARVSAASLEPRSPINGLRGAVEDRPQIVAMRRKLAEIDERLAAYAATAVDRNSPKIVQLRAERAAAQKQLDELAASLLPQIERQEELYEQAELNRQVALAESRLASFQEEEKFLTRMLEGIEKQINVAGGANSVQLEVLRHEIEREELMGDSLWSSLETLRIEEDAQPRVSLVALAKRPNRSNESKRNRLTALAGLGGFGLVVLGIGYVEHRSTCLRTADMVSRYVGLDVFGGASHSTRSAVRWSRFTRRPIIAERTDELAAALIGDRSSKQPRTIVVTSATSAESKDLLAAQLAASLARANMTTLLADLDLAEPALDRMFGCTGSRGLADVIGGRGSADDFMLPTEQRRLTLVPAGTAPSDPYSLLTNPALERWFAASAEKFDFVVVNAPAVIDAAAGAMVLGARADAVVLSVELDESRSDRIHEAMQRLATVGARVYGAVIGRRERWQPPQADPASGVAVGGHRFGAASPRAHRGIDASAVHDDAPRTRAETDPD